MSDGHGRPGQGRAPGSARALARRAGAVGSLGAALMAALGLLGGCDEETWDLTDPPFQWEPWEGCTTDAGEAEHPRPDLQRRVCLSLDGQWGFQLDPGDVGLTEGWAEPGRTFEDTILVPFPWTSAASGVGVDTGDGGGVGWYRRTVPVTAAFLESGWRYHLVVGAADWHTTLFVNGVEVATHDNGYLPLRVDVTDALVPGANVLVLRVADPGNDAEYPHGKQGTPWYTNVAGVWQSVYLELAGPTAIDRLTLRPSAEAVGRCDREAELVGATRSCVLRIYGEGRGEAPLARIPVTGPRVTGRLEVPGLGPWSPEDPQLLWLEARLRCPGGEDAVRTRVGWRTVSRGPVPGQGFEAIHLNGAPIFVRGVLWQGYDPEGLYAYRDRERIRTDLVAAREAGFNLVRLHIKVEDPWVLHLADELGVLLAYDVPCFGVFPFASGYTEASRRRWTETMEGMIRRDGGHPSVIWWTLWNEDWGLAGMDGEYDAERQAFVKETVARARELDPTRIVEDHSTLRQDHVGGTDVNSFHLYASDPEAFEAGVEPFTEGAYPGSTQNFVSGEAQDGAPLLNTEYGPFSFELLPEWQTDRDVSWGLRVLTGILRRKPPLVGYVFTELYDVEFEHNGLADYDRTPKEMGYPAPVTLAGLHGADFVGFEEPWFQVGQGDALAVTPFVTRWSTRPPEAGERLRLTLHSGRGEALATLEERPVAVAAYGLEVLAPVPVDLPPDLTGPAWVLAEWVTADGSALAAGYLPGEVVPMAAPAATCEAAGCLVPLDLARCTGDRDPDTAATVEGTAQAVGFLGEGTLSCEVDLPAEVRDATGLLVVFEGELAANAQGAPQTTAGAPGGEARVAFAGQDLGLLTLPPDRADSRGILSHLNGPLPAGGFGGWVFTAATALPGAPGATATVTFTVSGAEARGLVMYGPRMGRYGDPPVVALYR